MNFFKKLLVNYWKYSLKHWSINDNIQTNSVVFFQIFKDEINSLSFRSSFIINAEPIEPNLNGILVNKYNKMWYQMGNNKKL